MLSISCLVFRALWHAQCTFYWESGKKMWSWNHKETVKFAWVLSINSLRPYMRGRAAHACCKNRLELLPPPRGHWTELQKQGERCFIKAVVNFRCKIFSSITLSSWHNITPLGETNDPQPKKVGSFQPPKHKISQGMEKTSRKRGYSEHIPDLSKSCRFLYQHRHFEDACSTPTPKRQPSISSSCLPVEDSLGDKQKWVCWDSTFLRVVDSYHSILYAPNLDSRVILAAFKQDQKVRHKMQI